VFRANEFAPTKTYNILMRCVKFSNCVFQVYSLYRYALLRARYSWRSFSLDQKHITVSTQGGELYGEVVHHTVVTAHCVVLCARMEGYKLPACQVIFSDALPDEVFRELRVRLRYA